MPIRSAIRAALLLGGAVLPSTHAYAQPVLSPGSEEPAANSARPADASSGITIEDIVVTARRRDERLQDVPVSVRALSTETLERANVQTMADINVLVPGLRWGAEGGKDNISVSLRGISQIPLGEVTPGVVTYFANVPLPTVGSNLPTFDLASIQVLKGPQGTLFGRNTLGGAVLVSPKEPEFRLGGYVQGTYGRFDYRALEGALNLPLIEDKVAVRLAGQLRRQDGRIRNLDGGADFNDVHQNSFRASLLITPTEALRNLTVFDHFRAKEHAGGLYLLRHQPGVLGAIFGNAALGGFLDAQLADDLSQQRRNYYAGHDDGLDGGLANLRSWGVMNETSFSFGSITLRNIFGYRTNFADQRIGTGATGPLFLPTNPALLGPFPASAAGQQFTVFRASSLIERSYLTDEIQLLGDYGRFNFIVGAFFNHDKSIGPGGSAFNAFTLASTADQGITSHIENKNYAVFGQVGISLTDQLKATIGGRYSWDKVNACGGLFASGYVDRAACDARAETGAIDGIGTVRNTGEEPSWTFGLDYKPSRDLLLYAVTRRGYRGANVNTPRFESPFTTGGSGCSNPGGVCPDLSLFQKTGEERLTDGEVGAKYDFRLAGGRGRLNVAAYYTDYKNALQFLNAQNAGLPFGTPDAPNFGSVGANVADLENYGIEFEGLFSPIPSLSISVNGAYTHQRVTRLGTISFGPNVPSPVVSVDNINLPSPRFAGTVGVDWTALSRSDIGDVILHGDLHMTDDFGGQNGEKLPGYNLASVRIDWKNALGGPASISAYVRNIFAERYFTSPNVLIAGFPTSSVYVGEQRSWGFVMRYDF